MIKRLFKLSQYTDPLEYQKGNLITSLLTLVIVVYTLYITFLPYSPDGAPLITHHSRSANIRWFLIMGVFYGLAVMAMILVRIGQLKIASWMTLVAWVTLSVGYTYSTGYILGFPIMILIFTIVIGALVIGRNGLIAGLMVTLLVFGVGILSRDTLLLPTYAYTYETAIRNKWVDLIEISMSVSAFSILMWLFLQYVDFASKISVTDAVKVRSRLGEIITDMTQQVAERLTVQQLADNTIERIIKDFDRIYHAQIFLSDDTGTEARLMASTGEVGKKLIERAHGLKVGSVSVIGQVTYLGKYIIAQSGSSDSVHQRNELLPETQVEAAFPLRIGNRVIGALDLQSKDREAFSRDDLAESFQTLADSIGLAIDNIRQFERAEQRVKENQRLVEEAREALRQVERLNERLTGRIWSDYINGAGHEIGLAIDFESQNSITQAELTESIAEAIKSQQLVQMTVGDKQMITLPLRVRGRVVGAMEFELDKDGEFSSEDLDLLNEVSERFGVAIENVRLVNESQRTAQREAFVNQIVGRLQTMNNVEDMVTEAAHGLRDALKSPKIAIKLGTPPR